MKKGFNVEALLQMALMLKVRSESEEAYQILRIFEKHGVDFKNAFEILKELNEYYKQNNPEQE